jgi:hypothetical protein
MACFYLIADVRIQIDFMDVRSHHPSRISELFFPSADGLRDELLNYLFKNYRNPESFSIRGIRDYALISTSTPLGKSNLLNASTVREEEV